jgi:hypothetical protein
VVRPRILTIGAALLVGAVPALVVAAQAKTSSAQGPKKHKVSFTTRFDAVTLSGPQGAPGTRETDAGVRSGTIDGKSVGVGALEDSGTWGPGLVYHAKGISFDTEGSVNFTTAVKATPGQGGTLTFTGTFTAHGGTGRYTHASGTIAVTGSAPLGSDPDAGILHSSGTVRF